MVPQGGHDEADVGTYYVLLVAPNESILEQNEWASDELS